MKRWKRHLALLMLAVMGVQLLPVVGFAQPNSSPTLNENGLTADVEDGAILHTWCWSYATVKENISEIAASCGFNSLNTFNREFKTIVGVTPSEYRGK